MRAPLKLVSAVKWYVKGAPRFAVRFSPDEDFIVPQQDGRTLHMDERELARFIDVNAFYVLDTFVTRP